MAAVTINQTPPVLGPQRHVLGDLVVRFFNVSGASGSTLATGMSDILFVENQPYINAGTASLITGIVVNTATGLLTFTSSGPMVNEIIGVTSRVG